MTRLIRRRFLKTSLLAFASSLILIPAASAMPVLSDPAASAPAVSQTTPLTDSWYTPAVLGSIEQPLTDSWYTPAVLGSTDSFTVGRTTPDVPPVAGRATPAPVLTSPSGFDWSDAGIALALGLALTAFFVVGAQRARRTRSVPILH